MAKVLTSDCLCQHCKWPMKAGDSFRWVPASKYTVSAKTGMQRHNTVRPAHLQGQCFARIEEIERAEQDNALLDEMVIFTQYPLSFVLEQLRKQGHDYSPPVGG